MTEDRTRVPAYYYDDPSTAAILNALDRAGEWLLTAVEDHLQQMDVTTATWGLPLWEARHGIVLVDTADIDARRSAVMAKIRGMGTATAELVQTVADAWKNGAVLVGETAHGILLTFAGQHGIPDDIDALIETVRAVIPAGLLIEYDFRYLLIRDVHNTMTLAQLEATPLDHFAGGNYGK